MKPQELYKDLDPGYKCNCNIGYEGRGFMGECRDIDECFLQTHACVLTDGQEKVFEFFVQKFSIVANKIGLFFIMQAMVHVLLSTLRKIALIPLDHMYVRVYLAMALMWRPLTVPWVSIMSK